MAISALHSSMASKVASYTDVRRNRGLLPLLGFTKFTKLHVVTSQFVMFICACGLKTELDPDMLEVQYKSLRGKLLTTACYSFTGRSFLLRVTL